MGKMLDDGCEREREKWHIQSMRAYDLLVNRYRKWLNEMLRGRQDEGDEIQSRARCVVQWNSSMLKDTRGHGKLSGTKA